MGERPILMSAPMVIATLREVEAPGTGKTQTRRIIKALPFNKEGDTVDIGSASAAHYVKGSDGRMYFQFDHPRGGPLTGLVSRFNVGDRLWVRESWLKPYANTDTGSKAEMAGYIYRADGPEFNDLSSQKHQWGAEMKWRVSIRMPREASRLTLTVTDVRVERLQDISEGDAKAEGVTARNAGVGPSGTIKTYRTGFVHIWGEINGTESWLANPWVAAVSYRPELRNIDAPEGNQ